MARKLTIYAWDEGGLLTYLVEVETPRGPVTGEAHSLEEATRQALHNAAAAEEEAEA